MEASLPAGLYGRWRQLLLLLGLGWMGVATAAPPPVLLEATTNSVGLVTNGAGVWESWAITRIYSNAIPTNLPARLATNAVFQRRYRREYTYTNRVFHGYQEGTLAHLIWTNFLAHTNGRTLRIWSQRRHPPGWPQTPPVVEWNTNSVIWGMRGVTALSPCWEGEGNPGQIPLTALTRRHLYTRGHSFGMDGFNPAHNGKRVWFVTRDNRRIEAVIQMAVVRTPVPSRRDYSILLLDRDLPDDIETLPVVSPENRKQYYFPPSFGPAPYPLFQTEQGGNVSTGVPPLTVNTWKGGDPGSPDLIPLPGQLVFSGGRSTSGPSHEMQEDMDELCRRAGLAPAKYQLHWVDLGQALQK